jgi:hypothetical protein
VVGLGPTEGLTGGNLDGDVQYSTAEAVGGTGNWFLEVLGSV